MDLGEWDEWEGRAVCRKDMDMYRENTSFSASGRKVSFRISEVNRKCNGRGYVGVNP